MTGARSEQVTAVTRPRAAHKRAGILHAARELFLADGYERTSVDAIAARAGVSKRTVYDYFGDKRSVFASVVEVGSGSLVASIEAAVAEELGDDVDLDVALLAFARRITTQSLSSSHYAVLRRLLSGEGAHALTPDGTSPMDGPERLLGERFTAFAAAGRLQAEDPHRAADHFTALTFLLALDAVQPGPWQAPDAQRVDDLLIDGVRAFLRAYPATCYEDLAPGRQQPVPGGSVHDTGQFLAE